MNIKWSELFRNVCAVTICSFGFSSISHAATYSFSTADSQFDAGVNNQGFWSDGYPGSDNDDDVTTGYSLYPDITRSFFTFDLSGFTLAANEEIVGARFSGNTSQIDGTSVGTVTFFDVSTDAVTLNNNSGLSASIFEDLGTGNQYGSLDFFGGGPTSVDYFTAYNDFSIALNGFFLADAAAAQGNFLSIGGSVTGGVGIQDEIVFNYSDGKEFKLTLETRISTVPLPAALPLYGAGLAVLGFLGWRRNRSAAS